MLTVDVVVCEGIHNPLEGRKFHELSFYQRVCMLKALCEHCVVSTCNISPYNCDFFVYLFA